MVIRCLAACAAASAALLAAGCGGVETSGLPLHEEFTDCSGFTMNDEVATVDCPAQELRVLVSQPAASPVHFVPLRFDTTSETLVVSAQAHAPKPGGAWGVGCLGSGVGEPGRGYALLIGSDGAAAILRIGSHPGEAEDGRFVQEFEFLSESPAGTPYVLEPARRHLLRIRCMRVADGAVRLRGSIDGGNALTAKDDEGIAPFTAAFAIVATDRPGTDARFDNVKADGGG